MNAATVGVVLVTHNSARWLSDTLQSISAQTRLPNKVLVVDDHSTDQTKALVEEWTADTSHLGIAVDWTTSMATDQQLQTRIARNFTQGVRGLGDVEFVALSDHDDVWLPHRLEAQSELMREHGCSYLASNGLIDGTDESLFRAFEVPLDSATWNSTDMLRHVLRNSVATGSASMINRKSLVMTGSFVPPPGWLHDRWWSIVAATQGRLQLSPEPVINYRISTHQSVGLNRGRQTSRGLRRLASVNASDLRRVADLHSLKKEAAPELQPELTWGRLAKSLR